MRQNILTREFQTKLDSIILVIYEIVERKHANNAIQQLRSMPACILYI